MTGEHSIAAHPPVWPVAKGDGATRAVLVIAVSAGALSAAGGLSDAAQFFHSYLTAFAFVVSLVVGSLFWLMVHHLADAGWSVVIRRPMEHVARLGPWLALLALPVVLGIPWLYSWHDNGQHASDLLWQGKRPFLNVPFFVLRMAVYLTVWSWLGGRLAQWSTRQDATGDLDLTRRMQRLSGPGIALLGATITFAAIDWLMTLDFHWYSTIYGVYFWTGAILGSMACLILMVLGLRRAGLLGDVITPAHLFDMGKLLFAFVVFWTYIAFCQYLLIWYANLPEETTWYVRRLHGRWEQASLALLFGHFIVPFLLLLTQRAKRSPATLGFAAAWILAFHLLDIYWQVMPAFHVEGLMPHWLDVTTVAALLALTGLVVLRSLRRWALIPIRDPRLGESLEHGRE